MEDEQAKINRILRGMDEGETKYFHSKSFGRGDPMTLTKRKKINPTLLQGLDKSRIAKSIIDPVLGKYVRR